MPFGNSTTLGTFIGGPGYTQNSLIAPMLTVVQGGERASRSELDKVLTDVVILRLSQAIEQEVGGRRTETE
jgi:hypothetical protein